MLGQLKRLKRWCRHQRFNFQLQFVEQSVVVIPWNRSSDSADSIYAIIVVRMWLAGYSMMATPVLVDQITEDPSFLQSALLAHILKRWNSHLIPWCSDALMPVVNEKLNILMHISMESAESEDWFQGITTTGCSTNCNWKLKRWCRLFDADISVSVCPWMWA